MRIEGKFKMGYYPTPDGVVRRIKTFLEYPKDYTMLDPCCGTGKALYDLADENGRTYGVELDFSRYSKAKNLLTRAAYGGYEQLFAPLNSFSVLFLNPPYDYDESGERKEKIFLKKTIKYLVPGGVLIYIIPQHSIEDVAKILSYSFGSIRVYRFPDEEYKAFKQVVILGTKKKDKKTDAADVDYLINACRAGTKLETIPLMEKPVYKVPASMPPRYFNTGQVDEDYLRQQLANSKLLDRITADNTADKKEQHPPLPLHMAHIGLLLATGNLNGEIDGHVVKGVVKKIQKEDVTYEGDNEVRKITEELVVSINVLTNEGELIELI